MVNEIFQAWTFTMNFIYCVSSTTKDGPYPNRLAGHGDVRTISNVWSIFLRAFLDQ